MLEELARRYRLLKWRSLAKLGLSDMVVADVQGKKMYLDLADRTHCERIYTTGLWEDDVTIYFLGLLRSGMVVIDIGANVGYYTLLAADKVGPAGRVFAFEPEPSRYALLEKNVQANHFANITLSPKAVSNKTGTTQLYLSPAHDKTDARVFDTYDSHCGSKGLASAMVETTRLDDVFKEHNQRVDVIKMDIQGAEAAALEGMTETIRRQNELTLITEFWPGGVQACGFSPTEFLRTLVNHGFRLFVFKWEQIGFKGDDRTESLQEMEPEHILLHPCQNLVCLKGIKPSP